VASADGRAGAGAARPRERAWSERSSSSRAKKPEKCSQTRGSFGATGQDISERGKDTQTAGLAGTDRTALNEAPQRRSRLVDIKGVNLAVCGA